MGRRQTLKTKEEMREWLQKQPVDTRYCKCLIRQLDLFKREYSEEPELWGYAVTDDPYKAMRMFSKAIDEGLDGYLDYGYMMVEQYTVVVDEDGKRHGFRIAAYVNDFGEWKSWGKFRIDHNIKTAS